ncbi:MAG TPA: hypothetical protein VJ951_09045, partial [Bacteroidales bacterium]|nr:hypothetical protein [Bacteroidales bacterium]
MLNKIVILSLLASLLSCSEDWALVEETFLLNKENDNWVPETATESFIMTDENHISQGFVISGEDQYMDKSWGGFLGLNTHMSFTEYRHRSYSSTYGYTFYSSIRAGWEPFGDQISIGLNDVEFCYDLGLDTLNQVSTKDCRLSYLHTSEGYEGNEQIISTATVKDTLTINGKQYNDVIFFRLEDCPSSRGNFVIREIYFAKNAGLVK